MEKWLWSCVWNYQWYYKTRDSLKSSDLFSAYNVQRRITLFINLYTLFCKTISIIFLLVIWAISIIFYLSESHLHWNKLDKP